MKYKITNEQARRFMLRHHGLIGDRVFIGADGIVEFTKMCGCVQFDPVDVCGRSPDISLFSRVSGYTKEMLWNVLYEDRSLIEYFDKNLAIIPVSDWRYFSRIRESSSRYWRNTEQIEAAGKELIQIITLRGALSSKDIEWDERVDWLWSNNSKLSKVALEALYFRGELGVHHRKRSVRWYDLIENLIPEDELSAADPNSTDEELYRWWVLRRIGAVGLLWNRASDAWLCINGLKAEQRAAAFNALLTNGDICEVETEGTRNLLYCRADDTELLEEVISGAEYEPRTEFIAPLDAFIWDRKLIRELFGFEYTWEIYTPEVKRKYGYYTLPILHGDRFIGRTEMARDIKEDTLKVKAVWYENGVTPDANLKLALNNAYERFAAFNDCKKVEYDNSIEVLA